MYVYMTCTVQSYSILERPPGRDDKPDLLTTVLGFRCSRRDGVLAHCRTIPEAQQPLRGCEWTSGPFVFMAPVVPLGEAKATLGVVAH